MIPVAAILLVVVVSPAGEPIRLECEGEVEWFASRTGGSRMVLSGGVTAVRGDLTIRARRVELSFEEGKETPSAVRAEGTVMARTAGFTIRAGRAELSDIPGGVGFLLRLEPEEAGKEVELTVVDGAEFRCAGNVSYDSSAGELRLEGGVRGEIRDVKFKSAEGRIVLGRPGSPPQPPGERPLGAAPSHGDKTPTLESVVVERFELRGAVVLEMPRRSARAEAVFYEARNDLLVLSSVGGGRHPEVESAGAILSAPELRIHLRDGKIESATGRLRAVIAPRAERTYREEDHPAGER